MVFLSVVKCAEVWLIVVELGGECWIVHDGVSRCVVWLTHSREILTF